MDFFRSPSTKQRGAWATLLCAQYLSAQGHIVLMSICDVGAYDLAFDDGTAIQRVQCKYCTHLNKTKGFYEANLVLQTGKNVTKRKRYSVNAFDFLWVATPNGCYFIPAVEVYRDGIARPRIVLSAGYNKYAVSPIQIETQVIVRSKKGYHTHMTVEQKARMYELREQKTTVQAIADELGVTYNTISKTLYRHPKP